MASVWHKILSLQKYAILILDLPCQNEFGEPNGDRRQRSFISRNPFNATWPRPWKKIWAGEIYFTNSSICFSFSD